MQPLSILSIFFLSLASVAASLGLWKLGQRLDASTRRKVTAFFRKRLIYTTIFRRLKGSYEINVLTLSSVMLAITVNILGCTLKVSDRHDIAKRCATLFLINAVPLYLGGRTNIFVDRILRLSLSKYALIHHWLGRICVVQGFVHGIIKISSTSISTTEILLISLLSAIGVLSILYVRRYLYEVFLKSHLVFALMLAGTLWWHVPTFRKREITCLGVATAAWLLQHVAWLAGLFYRNSGSRSSNKVAITRFDSLKDSTRSISATVSLKRPWKVSPGQYVYLTFPDIDRHRVGFFQAHPYAIAWVDGSDITLLIQQYDGFSNSLFHSLHCHSSVIVDGPYGHSQSLNEYDKVLFMASGIGIAAHLLSIKSLLEAHENRTARARRLTLVWFVESSDQEAWSCEFLEKLFDLDQANIFTLALFVPDQKVPSKLSFSGRIDRFRRVDKRLNISEYITGENEIEAGNMVISVCGTPKFEEEVRRAVRQSDMDLHISMTEFHALETPIARIPTSTLVVNILADIGGTTAPHETNALAQTYSAGDCSILASLQSHEYLRGTVALLLDELIPTLEQNSNSHRDMYSISKFVSSMLTSPDGTQERASLSPQLRGPRRFGLSEARKLRKISARLQREGLMEPNAVPTTPIGNRSPKRSSSTLLEVPDDLSEWSEAILPKPVQNKTFCHDYTEAARLTPPAVGHGKTLPKAVLDCLPDMQDSPLRSIDEHQAGLDRSGPDTFATFNHSSNLRAGTVLPSIKHLIDFLQSPSLDEAESIYNGYIQQSHQTNNSGYPDQAQGDDAVLTPPQSNGHYKHLDPAPESSSSEEILLGVERPADPCVPSHGGEPPRSHRSMQNGLAYFGTRQLIRSKDHPLWNLPNIPQRCRDQGENAQGMYSEGLRAKLEHELSNEKRDVFEILAAFNRRGKFIMNCAFEAGGSLPCDVSRYYDTEIQMQGALKCKKTYLNSAISSLGAYFAVVVVIPDLGHCSPLTTKSVVDQYSKFQHSIKALSSFSSSSKLFPYMHTKSSFQQ
ncbi:hypothetical protein CC78DRAFT_622409 [Lojkania enalia]|uniref:ferric-chelate reductase (NADPH) n=1 Tax=Lojkania enalia TaxID=147567 RepID=A0A9P4N0I8_9PLEO|nr:hypothetical protein CC78DRAFT_622409 [Didymosphaeria enalia]